MSAGIDKAAGLSKRLVFRDKSVKTLQYCSRFLLGYYGSTLRPKSRALLGTIISQCSQGRKVFRLLKSVNMLQSLISKSSSLGNNSDEVGKLLGLVEGEGNTIVGYKQLAKYFEYLELIFIGIYFGLDNILFLGRSTIIPSEIYNPQALKWERATFGVWLANDISCFVKLILQIGATNIEIQRHREMILAARNDALVKVGASVIVTHVETSDIDKETLSAGADTGTNADLAAIDTLNQELSQLFETRSSHRVQLFKNLCDMCVSSGNLMMSSRGTRAYDWWDKHTPLCKLLASHTSIGLFGALSSLADISTML